MQVWRVRPLHLHENSRTFDGSHHPDSEVTTMFPEISICFTKGSVGDSAFVFLFFFLQIILYLQNPHFFTYLLSNDSPHFLMY